MMNLRDRRRLGANLVAIIATTSVTISISTTNAHITQDAIELPAPAGRFALGTLRRDLAETTRPEIMTDDPDDRRRLVIQMWYPARPDADDALASYVPDSPRWAEVYGPVGERMQAMRGHAFADAVPDTSNGPFPVVIVSHGKSTPIYHYTTLCEDLASHGYVVVAIDHAFTGVTLFDDGRMVGPDARFDTPMELFAEGPEAVEAHLSKLDDYLAADVSCVLDELATMNTAEASPVVGLLDLDHVATIGHSRGIRPAFRAAGVDDRIDACVGIDAVAPRAQRLGALPVPFMQIRIPDVHPMREQYQVEIHEHVRVAGFEVIIEGMGHNTCTDRVLLMPDQHDYAIDARRGLRVTLDCLRDFLNVHLRGAAPAVLIPDDPAHPELTVAVFPKNVD